MISSSSILSNISLCMWQMWNHVPQGLPMRVPSICMLLSSPFEGRVFRNQLFAVVEGIYPQVKYERECNILEQEACGLAKP